MKFMEPEVLTIKDINRHTTIEVFDVDGINIKDMDILPGTTEINLMYVPSVNFPITVHVENALLDIQLSGTSLSEITYILPQTNIDGVFKDCKYLKKVGEDVFLLNSNTTWLASTFENCVLFDPMLNLGCLSVFKEVQSLVDTFKNTAIWYIDFKLFSPVMKNLLNLTGTFANCRLLECTGTDLFKFTPKIYKLDATFRDCPKLEYIHQNMFSTLNRLRITTDVFQGTAIKEVNKNFLCSLNPHVKYTNLFPAGVKVNEFE